LKNFRSNPDHHVETVIKFPGGHTKLKEIILMQKPNLILCGKIRLFLKFKLILNEKNTDRISGLDPCQHWLCSKNLYLIDAISDAPKNNVTIVIDGNKIISVDNGFTSIPAGARSVDLKSKTVMPGWMDMHVHFEQETNPNRYLEVFQLNPADIAFNSLRFAEVTLMSGFTTVRDLGGSGVNISLRNAINKGLVKGPRVFSAGKGIGTTGGHADPTNGYRKDLMGNPGPNEGVVNGADDCRQAVRQRYKEPAVY
jgi:imidazolonepropionase-like amidohydrolase